MQIFNLANDKGAQNVMFGIFPEENNIIIHIFEEDIETNQAFINAAVEQYGPKIIIQPREELSNTKISINKRDLKVRLLGGDGLFNQNEESCSIGFFAKAKNETKNYIVTAEHCRLDSGNETEFCYGAWDKQPTNLLVGLMLPKVNEKYDFGLIDLSNMNEYLEPSQSIRNTDSVQFPQLSLNDGTPVLSHGAHLCKSGYSTHVSCGFVKAFNVIYYVGDGGFESDLIMTSMDSHGGDSGGTAFAYSNFNTVILNGILVSGIGNANTLILPLSMIIEHSNVEPITASNI
ncbi:S1 family peptidase [Gigaspora margarita]|uniref:S1 family peptidase n=1 Tax=Gigaspora margarita TaxID=4874 RepID=A0A8H4ERK4_GIGMA|nr:S1 family peptidase [Gigaspora margarita]